MNMLHKAMTIAGSDASGGAGMEADLKTFQELAPRVRRVFFLLCLL